MKIREFHKVPTYITYISTLTYPFVGFVGTHFTKMTKTEKTEDNKMTDYKERIKRRLPAGYDRLFGSDDETDNRIGSEARPPTVRPGPDDPAGEGDPIQPVDPEGPAAA